jgi:hypothetical protein
MAARAAHGQKTVLEAATLQVRLELLMSCQVFPVSPVRKNSLYFWN